MKKRRRRIVAARARPQPPLGLEGVEVQPRRKSGVYSETGTGLVTRLGSQHVGRGGDRVTPERPPAPRTAKEVERRDRIRRAADPRDDARARARDVIAKGGDLDAPSDEPAVNRRARVRRKAGGRRRRNT